MKEGIPPTCVGIMNMKRIEVVWVCLKKMTEKTKASAAKRLIKLSYASQKVFDDGLSVLSSFLCYLFNDNEFPSEAF